MTTRTPVMRHEALQRGCPCRTQPAPLCGALGYAGTTMSSTHVLNEEGTNWLKSSDSGLPGPKATWSAHKELMLGRKASCARVCACVRVCVPHATGEQVEEQKALCLRHGGGFPGRGG